MSQRPVALSKRMLRMPNVVLRRSTLLPPTDTAHTSVYSAGVAGGETRYHSAAPGMASGAAGLHTVGALGETVPEPDAVATTAPLGSTTVRATEKACGVEDEALLHSSTDGVRVESAYGVPSEPHVMLPVTCDGAYTPHGAMYGPGVETTVR